MRIVLLANNWVGLKVTEFLREQKENILLLAIHEQDKQTYTKEIIRASGLTGARIILAHTLREPDTIDRIRNLAPDIILSAFWAYILRPDIFEIPRLGTVNFHPAYLPFNRGLHPNVWSFLEGTPAGVTLHYVDNGVDTGDIIAREKVPIHPLDTAETLYNKTLVRIVELFKKEWPLIKKGKNARIPQSKLSDAPTFHKRADMDTYDYIDLNNTYTGKELINRLRARSYSDRYYAWYTDNGVNVSVRLQMRPVRKPVKTTNVKTGFSGKKLANLFYCVKRNCWPRPPASALLRLANGKHLEMYCICREIAGNPDTIRLLTSWRKKSARWFPSQFPVTMSGTKRWYNDQVFRVPDRILFFLRIAGSNLPFGHIGLNRYNDSEKSIEIDNVVRGADAPHSRGAMTAAMAMLEQWARENLPVRRLALRVFADNEAAIALYKRAGFVTHEEIPLRLKIKGTVKIWIEDRRIRYPKRKFVRMMKDIV